MKVTPKVVALGSLVAAIVILGAEYLFTVAQDRNDVDIVDIEAGRQFALLNCSACHAIGIQGDSPRSPAPPFRTLSKRWPLENLEEALAEGIVTGHPAMPEFELTPQQIADFIGYLETIQQR